MENLTICQVKRLLRHYWPTLIVLIVIIYATWVPKPVDPEDIPPIPYIDKLIHAIMMGGLTGALAFDYKRQERRHMLTLKVMTVITAGVLLFGVVDEIVQGLLPIGRPSDPWDLVADWAGTLIGAVTAPPAVNAVVRRMRR